MNNQNSIQNFPFQFKATEQANIERRSKGNIDPESPKKSFQETLNQRRKNTSTELNSGEEQNKKISLRGENTPKNADEKNDYQQEIPSREKETIKGKAIPQDIDSKIEDKTNEINYQSSIPFLQPFDAPSTGKTAKDDEEAPIFLDCSCIYATMLDASTENNEPKIFDCEKNKETFLPLNEDEGEETPKISKNLYEEKRERPLSAGKVYSSQTDENTSSPFKEGSSQNTLGKESLQKIEVKQTPSNLDKKLSINSSVQSEKTFLNGKVNEDSFTPDLKNVFGIKFATGEDKTKDLMLRTNTGLYSEKTDLETKELNPKNLQKEDSLSLKSSDYFFKTGRATNRFETNNLAQDPQELLPKVALQKYDMVNKGYTDSVQETIATLIQQMDDMKRFKRNVVQVKIDLENGESVNCQLTLFADNLNIRFSSMEESFKEHILQHWDRLKTTAARHHLLLQTPSFIQN